MAAGKTKLTCYGCGASYSLDLNKVPADRKALKCLKCGKLIPILDRVLPAGGQDEASDQPEAAPRAAAAVAAASALEAVDQAGPGGPPPEPEEQGDSWLALYGDMMSILLIFFILMFAISTIDKAKFQSVIQAVSQALGGSIKYEGRLDITPPSPMEVLKGRMAQEQSQLKQLQGKLQRMIEQNNLQDAFNLVNEPKGLVLIGRDIAMFDSGKADIKPGIRPMLARVADLLAGIANDIVVEGHTDDVPINTPQFASNWELSAQRATNVVRFLLDRGKINPARLSAAGYAYFRPRHPHGSADSAKNRRIEIVIKKRYDPGLLKGLEGAKDGPANG